MEVKYRRSIQGLLAFYLKREKNNLLYEIKLIIGGIIMKNLTKVCLAFAAGMLTLSGCIVYNESKGDTVYEDDSMKIVAAGKKTNDNKVVAVITYK